MKILTRSRLPESLVAALPASADVTITIASSDADLLREITDADALIGGFGGGDTDGFAG